MKALNSRHLLIQNKNIYNLPSIIMSFHCINNNEHYKINYFLHLLVIRLTYAFSKCIVILIVKIHSTSTATRRNKCICFYNSHIDTMNNVRLLTLHIIQSLLRKWYCLWQEKLHSPSLTAIVLLLLVGSWNQSTN